MPLVRAVISAYNVALVMTYTHSFVQKISKVTARILDGAGRCSTRSTISAGALTGNPEYFHLPKAGAHSGGDGEEA
jgi:hypothetical protein